MSYSREDCIEALIEASERAGRSVGYEEYQGMDLYPSIPVMTRIFGSFNEAKEAANLETRFGGNDGRDINEEYFSDINSTEKAYWLGFIYGDGWVSLDRDGLQDNFGVEIIDHDHLLKFQEAINSNHTLSEKEKQGNNTFKIQIDNDVFVSHLVNNGVTPNKTFGSSLPNIKSSDLQAAFIRGLFDADGSLSDGGWSLTSSSQERLLKIQGWIPAETKINQQGEIYELRAVSSKQRLISWLYPEEKETEPALQRKKEQATPFW